MNKKEIIKKWKKSGLLDNLTKMDENMNKQRIIKVPVPKEIWDADMSIWNVLFGRRDIMGAWMNSIKDVIKQIKQ
jgi:hypothetical protein